MEILSPLVERQFFLFRNVKFHVLCVSKGNLKVSSGQLNRFTRNLVAGMSRGDALLPVILLEAFVTGGRTYQAYQRGGVVEARERATEETLGAVFWFGGVQAFNKLGDRVGQKVFGLKDIKDMDFSVGKDAVRKPFENYLKKMPQLNSKNLAAFKFAKIVASILLSNAVIGFVVPKLNQAITSKYKIIFDDWDKKLKNQCEDDTQTTNTQPTQNSQNPAQNPNFKGIEQTLLSLTHKFENDSRYKLLSSDAGIAGGRAVNARNKHERTEALVRDLGSIYFYFFCKNHIASMFNYLQDGRKDRLDPVSVEILDTHLQENLKASYTPEEFEKLVMGKNVAVPDNVRKGIKNGIIALDDFKKLEADKKLCEVAQSMSELQPKIKGVSILTAEQVKDVYTGGLINNPKMLREVFDKFSGGKSLKEMDYYPESELRSLKGRMHDYVTDIIKKVKPTGEMIDANILKRTNKMNFVKNAFNLTAGLAVAGCFLATIIPKIQYWVTEKKTGENKFPGVQVYED